MGTVTKVTGQINSGLPAKIFRNEGVLAVIGATIGTASAIALVRRFTKGKPKLTRNIQVVLIVVGVLLFTLVMSMGSALGIFRFLIVGVSAGLILAGVIPLVGQRFGIDLLGVLPR